MAYVNSTRAESNGLGDRFATLVKAVKTVIARRAIYAQTLRELNGLSNRELADLGIARANIGAVAREAAFGK